MVGGVLAFDGNVVQNHGIFAKYVEIKGDLQLYTGVSRTFRNRKWTKHYTIMQYHKFLEGHYKRKKRAKLNFSGMAIFVCRNPALRAKLAHRNKAVKNRLRGSQKAISITLIRPEWLGPNRKA